MPDGGEQQGGGLLMWGSCGCAILAAIIALLFVFFVLGFVGDNTTGGWFQEQSGGGPGGGGTLGADCKDIPKDYIALFNKYGNQFGVSPALLAAITKKESTFNPNADNKLPGNDHAIGLMQVTHGTAGGIASALGESYSSIDQLRDPERAIRYGSNYTSQMLKRFGGNLDKALAAYNAGPGRVDQYGGIPPYAETQNYVVLVKQYYADFQKCLSGGGISTGVSAPTVSAQELAQKILNHKNILLLKNDPENDNKSSAWQNIKDTADGKPAWTSIRGHIGQKPVNLDPNMLAGILKAADIQKLQINFILGGKHKTINSKHYSGKAFDMYPSGDFEKLKSIMGANWGHTGDHYHFQWP